MTETTVSSDPFSPESLVDLPIPARPRLSPNGRHVIYETAPKARSGEDDKTILWLAQTDKADSARQLTSGLYNDHSAEWRPTFSNTSTRSGSPSTSNDKTKKSEDKNGPSPQVVSFVSDRAKPGKSSAIYLVPTDVGGEAYPVSDTGNEKHIAMPLWSPNGTTIAFISADEDSEAVKKKKQQDKDDVKVFGEHWEYGRLRLLDVGSRSVRTLFAHQGRHVIRFAWSPDGKQIVLATCDDPGPDAGLDGVKLHVYSLVQNKVLQTVPFGNMIWGLVWGGPATGINFLGGVTAHSVQSANALWSLSLEDSACRRVGYGDDSCAEDLRTSCGGGGPALVKVSKGVTDSIVMDGTTVCQLDRAIAAWDACSIDDDDGSRTVVAYCTSDVNTPTEVYVCGVSKSDDAPLKLSNHGRAIADAEYAQYQPLETVSYDGTTKLEGHYVSPKGHDPKTRLPTLLSIHGGPYYRLTNTFDPTGVYFGPRLLASGKYGVLVVNYRGGMGYGEKYAAQARGAMGTVEYEDVLALVEEAIRRGLVDKSRIITSGWSQGGFLSYISSVRNGPGQSPRRIPDWNYAAAICGAGVADWDVMSMASDAPKFESELAGVAPWATDKADLRGRLGSAIWELEKGHKNVPPMLLLHGEADERVPVVNAVAFHRGCVTYGIPCEMALYPREGHDFQERAHAVDLINRVKRFVDLHIGS